MPVMPEHVWSFRAKPLRAIDGDTCEVLLDRGYLDQSIKRIRLAGVNAAELYGATPEAAEAARCYVEQWLGIGPESQPEIGWEWPVLVVTEKTKAAQQVVMSFERFVGWLYWRPTGQCLNQALVDDGVAVKVGDWT